MGRAIRHRDAQDEVMADVVAALRNQRFLFAEQGLVAFQQGCEVRAGRPHGLFQQGVALFVEIDECIHTFRSLPLAGGGLGWG